MCSLGRLSLTCAMLCRAARAAVRVASKSPANPSRQPSTPHSTRPEATRTHLGDRKPQYGIFNRKRSRCDRARGWVLRTLCPRAYCTNMCAFVCRPPSQDYNSSLALSTILDTAVAVAWAASFTFLGSGRKLPSLSEENARSKRAPRYHAVPICDMY